MEKGKTKSDYWNIDKFEQAKKVFSRRGLLSFFAQSGAVILFLSNIDGFLSFLSRIDPNLRNILSQPGVAIFILDALKVYLLCLVIFKLLVPVVKIVLFYFQLINKYNSLRGVSAGVWEEKQRMVKARDQNILDDYTKSILLLEIGLMSLLNGEKWSEVEIISSFFDTNSGELTCELNGGSDLGLTGGVVLEVIEEPSGTSVGGVYIKKCLSKKSFCFVIFRDMNKGFWDGVENKSFTKKNDEIPSHSLKPFIPEHLNKLQPDEIQKLIELTASIRATFTKSFSNTNSEIKNV